MPAVPGTQLRMRPRADGASPTATIPMSSIGAPERFPQPAALRPAGSPSLAPQRGRLAHLQPWPRAARPLLGPGRHRGERRPERGSSVEFVAASAPPRRPVSPPTRGGKARRPPTAAGAPRDRPRPRQRSEPVSPRRHRPCQFPGQPRLQRPGGEHDRHPGAAGRPPRLECGGVPSGRRPRPGQPLARRHSWRGRGGWGGPGRQVRGLRRRRRLSGPGRRARAQGSCERQAPWGCCRPPPRG